MTNYNPCCAHCRTPSGVCASRYTCDHHRVAEALDEVDAKARRTVKDPTANTAIRNVMSARRPRRPRL